MVSELLRESWRCHGEALALRRAGRRDEARVALLGARTARLAAVVADPERVDPAWAAEQEQTPRGVDTHEALMQFYERQCGDAG